VKQILNAFGTNKGFRLRDFFASHKGTLGDVKFKKIKFLQEIKVYIAWMTTVFFLSAEGENYP